MKANDACAKADQVGIQSAYGIFYVVMCAEKGFEVMVSLDRRGNFVDNERKTLQSFEVIAGNLSLVSHYHSRAVRDGSAP